MKDFETRVEKLVEARVSRRLRGLLRSLKENGRGTRTTSRSVTARHSANRIEEIPVQRRAKANGKPSLSRKRQGAYMAAVRGLDEDSKAEVRSVKERKGIVKAIALAKKLAAASA